MGNDVIRLDDIRKSADALAAKADDAFGDATRKEKYLALRGPESKALVPVNPPTKTRVSPYAPKGWSEIEVEFQRGSGGKSTALVPSSAPVPATKKDKPPKPPSTMAAGANAARALAQALRPLKDPAVVKAAGGMRQAMEKQLRDFGSPLPRSNSDIDAKGVVFRNGSAYWKGMAVRSGGEYSPKGFLGRKPRDKVFVCKSVEWQVGGSRKANENDRLIAVGHLELSVYLSEDFGEKPHPGAVENRWYYVTDLAPLA